MKPVLPGGYKVVYEHYPTMSKRPPIGCLELVETMGTTAYVSNADDERVAYAEAIVNPNYDSYNRKLGNEIALGRALKELERDRQAQAELAAWRAHHNMEPLEELSPQVAIGEDASG